MINNIKKNIVKYIIDNGYLDIDDEIKNNLDEYLEDIWDECELYLNKNNILNRIYEIFFEDYNDLEFLYEISVKIESENVFHIDKLEDIRVELLKLDIVEKRGNIILFDIGMFLESKDKDLDNEQLSLLYILFEDKKIFNKIINSKYNYILIVSLDKIDCTNKEDVLKKTLLAFYNIPYKKHLNKVDNSFYKLKSNEQFECIKDFEQYNYILNIYHEYLNSDDPLWKFLLLYHIIENFAFRIPIVNQLKNFKKLTVNNISTIYETSQKEKGIIKKSLKDLISSMDKNELNLLLKNDSDLIEIIKYIDKDLLDSSGALQENKFGELIYKIRNCIVHNKETEWLHIDHNLLNSNDKFFKLFNEYLLPNLEKIVRYAIFNKDSITDYSNEGPNYILLWGEEPIG